MDIYDVAAYFDGLEVKDAYTEEYLFTGQLDQYDSSERDSMTGWRRSCSAREIVPAPRGVVDIAGQKYITGRVVKDYFDEFVIREHVILHPADGIFVLGSAHSFLTETATAQTQFYGALALRKEQKEESVSSQFFNLYNIYASMTEDADRDLIIKDHAGKYYRVQNVEVQTGQFKTFYASELGAAVFIQVGYTSTSGAYDPITDSSGTAAPIVVSAFVERYQTNFRYLRWAAEKYHNGDAVVTVSAAEVVNPKSGEVITIGAAPYRILARQSDGNGCWELHVRPN